MPTPPKESIGGTKGHQIIAFEFSNKEFEYLKSQEILIASEDFSDFENSEKESILNEFEIRSAAYETLRIRVEDY